MALLRRLAPFASLIVSVLSAALMDRDEDKGGYVVGFAVLSFFALTILEFAHRPHLLVKATGNARAQAIIRFTAFATNQSLLQLCLFFSGPFYLQAAAFTVPQCLFFVAFGVTAAVVSWDPLCAFALLHPVLGPLLAAFSSFVAWNAALPMLGVPHGRALWAAACLVSVLVPLVYLLRGLPPKTRTRSLLAGALLPLALAGLCTTALPAAPLKVVDAGIGTGVKERTLVGRARVLHTVPDKLWCFSAVYAPRGLTDELVHVWRRDGAVLSRIPLSVRGGRKRGFRTWSAQAVPRRARGTYRCEVVTPLGQVLSVSTLILEPGYRGERACHCRCERSALRVCELAQSARFGGTLCTWETSSTSTNTARPARAKRRSEGPSKTVSRTRSARASAPCVKRRRRSRTNGSTATS